MANSFLSFSMIKMILYKNKHGKSGVKSYSLGDDYILVEFNGAYYLYSFESAGYEAIAEMKRKAKNGQGLSGFISKYVRERYEKMYKDLKEMENYLERRLVKS